MRRAVVRIGMQPERFRVSTENRARLHRLPQGGMLALPGMAGDQAVVEWSTPDMRKRGEQRRTFFRDFGVAGAFAWQIRLGTADILRTVEKPPA